MLGSWARILDELERQIGRAAARPIVSVGASGIWSIAELSIPFDGLDELPPELVARARRILGDYDRVIAQLDRARAEIAGHLTMIDTVPRQTPGGTAVYLDRLG